MKYILITLLFLGIGCKEPTTNTSNNIKQEERTDSGSYRVERDSYKGHTYLIFNGWKKLGMVHDPDCVCGNAK